MKGLSDLNETYRKYSLARTDDLVIFWRSKVKVTADRQGGALEYIFQFYLLDYPACGGFKKKGWLDES